MGKGGVRLEDRSEVKSKWAAYTDIIKIAKTSISVRILEPFPSSRFHRDKGIDMEVKPLDFLIWANDKEFDIPDELRTYFDIPRPGITSNEVALSNTETDDDTRHHAQPTHLDSLVCDHVARRTEHH